MLTTLWPSERDPAREREAILGQLADLHGELDRQTEALAARHQGRLVCGRGCAACCLDDIRVFTVEAENIRREHGELLAQGVPHAPGACAFLDQDGACRIYAQRPYVCRTQGLPLRWWVDDGPGGASEQRDICELNEQGPPITELDASDCWTIGPFEGRLAALQERLAPAERVALRALFGSDAS